MHHSKSHDQRTQNIKEEILVPLELNNTLFSLKEVDVDDVMSGYYVGNDANLKTNENEMLGTAEDVGIFLRALNNASVFDEGEQEIYSSICRGCMHLNQATDWTDGNNWYTGAAPVFYYAKILHEAAVGGLAYALSYDDIFGTDPSIYISGYPNVDVTFDVV
jgi:hypothetical protein